jgi:hypothetical protein
MYAGNSNTEFIGKEVKTIEVLSSSPQVISADVRDISVTEKLGADGTVTGYSVCGTVYILMSDGTATPYSSIFLFFGADETARDVWVDFTLDGKPYSYLVTVRR